MSFAVAVTNPKREANVGKIVRSAYCMGASAVYIIGHRWRGDSCDTAKAWRHMPVMHFVHWDEYLRHAPKGWMNVGVEITDNSVALPRFIHPKHCVYLLGPEDGSLNKRALETCISTVQIPTQLCLNLAVAGSIVMYDRISKQYTDSGKFMGRTVEEIGSRNYGEQRSCEAGGAQRTA